jgi:CubicO group peptidase (beta-lactamase class C family)
MQKAAEQRSTCYKHAVRLIALLVALALLPGASALPPTRDQLLSLFGAYFEALRVQTGIPGMAAAIVGDTDIIWDQGFGIQDIGNGISTRADTPFQVDGLTQVMTATLLLRCTEEGRLGLDDPLGQYIASTPEPATTLRQVLTHTSGSPGNLTFSYNVARLELLRPLMPVCFNQTLRQAYKSLLLNRLAMVDSVPGLDAIAPTLPPEDLATPAEADLYSRVLARLAVPYAVSQQGISASHFGVTTLSPGTGLISTVRDFAKFDLAVRQGILVRGESLAAAWTPPVRNGGALPHGMGWFVQSYKGELVVWQFGSDTNASSALVITIPARGITLILLANSDGLAKPATLVAGDVTVSPFARVFLSLVVK